MTDLTLCAAALGLEALLGYPSWLFEAIGHPVSWMGAAIARLDRRWNREADAPSQRRRQGIGLLLVLALVCALVAIAVTDLVHAALPPALAVFALALLASTCLAQRSLDTHVRAVAIALERDGVASGRRAVAHIVGRDTTQLDAGGVALAAIESLAESFADGVAAPAFWLATLGLPGVVLLKLVNTADSMIGHRTPRHADFGWAAARTDDVLIWPGARLAALFLIGAAALTPGASARAAWTVMRRDARRSPSPNAGWPEAAMAGALGLRLGGARRYDGDVVETAIFGEDGRAPSGAADIRRALRLYRIACVLETVLVGGLAALIAPG